ncbi:TRANSCRIPTION FACTOR BHLH30 [Salix koriyanagi]|uniref:TRANSCRIPTION FACTOR BHLH30 n=1 Tax=Salix koriyanagi TaxID=2511006 RepID=A0A9Q0VZQ2_9ROSI|nr:TRANSCRIPTION FACTOR BHLH30 [Salix koriyanagi]
MEPCSRNSARVRASACEGVSDVFVVNSGLQAETRNGSCSTSSLVLDNERGELVEATVRMERKGVSAERSIAALKNHSEAERKRRARINTHLDTLRSLVPGASKMDKASLLAEVIGHLKELKSQAAEAGEGLLMPLDIDEPEILSDLRKALDDLNLIIMRAEIATLEGRMKNVFVMSSCKEGLSGDSKVRQFLTGSIHKAFRSILDKFSQEFSLESTLSSKRRRAALFQPSLSSSSGDLW